MSDVSAYPYHFDNHHLNVGGNGHHHHHNHNIETSDDFAPSTEDTYDNNSIPIADGEDKFGIPELTDASMESGDEVPDTDANEAPEDDATDDQPEFMAAVDGDEPIPEPETESTDELPLSPITSDAIAPVQPSIESNAVKPAIIVETVPAVPSHTPAPAPSKATSATKTAALATTTAATAPKAAH